jgi:hypothetical protein
MLAWRIGLGAAGLLFIGYGVLLLPANTASKELVLLALWLIAAIVVHDAMLAPAVIGIGWLLRRFVPDRGRRYLQAALVVGAFITVIAVPLILRQGTQPRSKALLQLPYGAHYALLLGMIAGVSLVAYAARVARDRANHRSLNAAHPGIDGEEAEGPPAS